MKKELLEGLTPEQLEKARACKSQEELLKLAKKEGIELTDEQLKAVNGGGCVIAPRTPPHVPCPYCGSEDTGYDYYDISSNEINYHCNKCHMKWEGKF